MAKKVIRSDIRVNKYISDSGFCSRREADKMIADERVTINGELATLGNRRGTVAFYPYGTARV